jgi:hypothetical protein
LKSKKLTRLTKLLRLLLVRSVELRWSIESEAVGKSCNKMAFQVQLGVVVRTYNLNVHNIEYLIRRDFNIEEKLPVLLKPLNKNDSDWISARNCEFVENETYTIRPFDLDHTLPANLPIEHYFGVLKQIDFFQNHLDIVSLISNYAGIEPAISQVHFDRISKAMYFFRVQKVHSNCQ